VFGRPGDGHGVGGVEGGRVKLQSGRETVRVCRRAEVAAHKRQRARVRLV
jgi:hypothetical protein